MKWFLGVCILLAVIHIVTPRPNKDKNDDYDDVLNDEDGYANIGDDDIEEEGEDEEQSDPPVIKTEPLKFKAVVGDNVYLPCLTENAESFSIMWKKNSVMIFQDKIQVGQRNERFQRFNNQTLEIKNIQPSDDGEYECSISTSPDLTAVKHTITVLIPPKIIKATANKQSSVSIPRGSDLELECIAEGNPEPKVSWSKNGQRISAEHSEYSTSRVFKQNVGRDDTGVYVCMADNELKKDPTLETITVEVTHKPDMKLERTIAGVSEVHLICKVHAHPKGEVTWLKNNKPIVESEDVRFEYVPHNHDHIVKIMKMNDSNFGTYTCVANNSVGSTLESILINGVPLMPKYENHRYLSDNELQTIWHVMSMTPIKVAQLQYRKKADTDKTWTIETMELPQGSGHEHTVTYVIKNLKEGLYEVRLRAENEYGWSKFSKQFSLEGKTSADSISKKEDPVEESPADPKSSVNVGVRTITSWTLVLCAVLLNLHRLFV